MLSLLLISFFGKNNPYSSLFLNIGFIPLRDTTGDPNEILSSLSVTGYVNMGSKTIFFFFEVYHSIFTSIFFSQMTSNIA